MNPTPVKRIVIVVVVPSFNWTVKVSVLLSAVVSACTAAALLSNVYVHLPSKPMLSEP